MCSVYGKSEIVKNPKCATLTYKTRRYKSVLLTFAEETLMGKRKHSSWLQGCNTWVFLLLQLYVPQSLVLHQYYEQILSSQVAPKFKASIPNIWLSKIDFNLTSWERGFLFINTVFRLRIVCSFVLSQRNL